MTSEISASEESQRMAPQPTPIKARTFFSPSRTPQESTAILSVQPEELVFEDVRPNQTYIQPIRIFNNIKAPVEFDIKCGNTEMYSVTPTHIQIPVSGFVDVRIQLKLKQVPKSRKRDIFHIKSDFFDQKFFAVISDRSKSPQTRPRVSFQPSASNINTTQEKRENVFTGQQNTGADTVIKADGESGQIRRLQVEVAEKDELLNLSKERISNLLRRISESPSMAHNPPVEIGVLKSENVVLQRELLTARRQLEDTQLQLSYLVRVEQIVKDSVPHIPSLVEAVVAKEREETELKNKRILEMFTIKDNRIAELDNEVTLQKHIIQDLQQQVLDAHILMDSIQQRNEELLRERKDVINTAEKHKEESLSEGNLLRTALEKKDEMIESLQIELEECRAQLSNFQEIHSQTLEELKEKSGHIQSMKIDLATKTRRIEELEKRELHLYKVIDQQVEKEAKVDEEDTKRVMKKMEETIYNQKHRIE